MRVFLVLRSNHFHSDSFVSWLQQHTCRARREVLQTFLKLVDWVSGATTTAFVTVSVFHAREDWFSYGMVIKSLGRT